jgi:predicted CoA-binding protein/ferredoxin
MTPRTITLANRGNATYLVDPRRSLLECLREQGVDLPYGCRYGGCITCAAKLIVGKVDQRRQVALNNRQLSLGYVILCVARPLTDCTFEIGVESHDNHDEGYSDAYLQGILKSVKTIAMVGASPDKTKFSYGVLRVLQETGYDMIPVNPNPAVTSIRGLKVYPTLKSIDRPVDMVQVFRNPKELPQIAREAVAIGAKVLWGQLGVRNDDAARIAEDAGLKVVMDRCPKIELFRPFWRPKLHLVVSA